MKGLPHGRVTCGVLAAIDFTTVEVWTPKGLVTYYLVMYQYSAEP